MARYKVSYKKVAEIAKGRREVGLDSNDEDYWDEIYDDNDLENRRSKFRRSTKAERPITLDD